MDRRTVDGIIYLSHIDLNDVPQFLTLEEYQLCKEAGVIFDENVKFPLFGMSNKIMMKKRPNQWKKLLISLILLIVAVLLSAVMYPI